MCCFPQLDPNYLCLSILERNPYPLSAVQMLLAAAMLAMAVGMQMAPVAAGDRTEIALLLPYITSPH